MAVPVPAGAGTHLALCCAAMFRAAEPVSAPQGLRAKVLRKVQTEWQAFEQAPPGAAAVTWW